MAPPRRRCLRRLIFSLHDLQLEKHKKLIFATMWRAILTSVRQGKNVTFKTALSFIMVNERSPQQDFWR
jgi:hypothetical protein